MQEAELMEITPLGAGCEVGRSCCIVRFRGATIMFDAGLHPAYSGLAALPYFDEVDLSSVDILLVTHFHMDHCGAVPYLTEKTNFRGRVFMTHPTKAIFKILQHDAVKVGHDEGRLFDEKDMLSALDKIELINYHQTLEHRGIKFTCYNAGHVLGAAMFAVEVAGVRVLYTGDFSREEDRHLLSAEIPSEPPHVLIVESTYGVSLHEPQAVREQRFTSAIHQIVARGGKCLIPVFALGRSQEILLILDEYWKAHPELHEVPIFYASKVAKKSMRVYQTYINMMNEHVRSAHAAGTNPWEFTHVQNLDFGRGGATALSNFDDSRPMVVMASPGMMQSGFSRELFEMWCSDKRNGLMMPGYAVAGTLAHHLVSEPKEITTSAGDRVPVNLSIHYISFSAHSDYAQTSKFIQALSPAHVVLVHGAEDVMGTLQRELVRHFKGTQTDFLMPKNCQSVHLRFRGDKVARVHGSLAQRPPEAGLPLSGLLLKKDFKYTLMDAADLPNSTPLASITLMQRPSFKFTGRLDELLRGIEALFALAPHTSAEDEKSADGAAAAEGDAAAESSAGGDGKTSWKVHEEVILTHDPSAGSVEISWPSGPLNDMIADAVAACLLQLQARQLTDGSQQAKVHPPRDAPSAPAEPAVKLEAPEPPTPASDPAAPAEGDASSAPAVVGSTHSLDKRRTHVLRVLEEHFGSVKKLSDAAAAVVALKHSGEARPSAVKSEEPAKAALGNDAEAAVWWELTACGQRVLLEGGAARRPHEANAHGSAVPFAQLVCEDEEARARVARVIDLANGSVAAIPARAGELADHVADPVPAA